MAEDKEASTETVKKEEPLPDFQDVSKELFKLCRGLEVGELVTAKQFKMAEVMSAIELMEPKMDVGVNSRILKDLDMAKQEGLYSDDFPLQLAIIDATLAMTVAWLEGASLGSTVWTNIMLINEKRVRHPIFSPFCAGMNLLIRNIHSLVNNVGNIEELPEDFNPQAIFMQTKWRHRQEVIQVMRDQMAALTKIGKTWKACPRAEQMCIAIGARFEFIILLLETMGMLIPPEIEDPTWGHRRHMGNHQVVLESEYTGDEEESELEDPQKEAIKNNPMAKDVVKKMVEAFGEKVAKDGVEQGVQKAAEQKCEGKGSEENKTEENKCCSSEDHFGLDEDEVSDESDSSEDIQFKPAFQFAAVVAKRLSEIAKLISITVNLGRKGPDNEDGDYSWLMPFDPKACIGMIPATFPRSVKIPSRKDSAKWWEGFTLRLQELIALTPASTKDLNMMFFFAKRFCLNACVFTRSLLQVCMFPVDSHILGDDFRTVAHPIEVSLRKCFMPQVLDEESPVNRDPLARQLYNTWLTHMTKLAINIYSSFGCNLSRQRDRLELAIEELSAIQYHAGQLEARTDEVLVGGKYMEKKEVNFAYQATITFVFHNLLAVTHQYFELGFRMDLYVPYELPYIYWFMGSLQAHWMATTMNRSKEIQMNYWKSNPLSKTTNPAELRKRQILEEELRARMRAHAVSVMNQLTFMKMAEGIIKMTVVLIRKELIRVPPGGDEAERLRFERRFEPFQNLGCPLSVEYEEFKEKSGIDSMYTIPLDDLIEKAREDFCEAYTKLQAIDNSKEQNPDTMFVDAAWSLKHSNYSSALIRINKANYLACQLIKSLDLSNRSVEWGFDAEFPMFPSLQIKQIAKKSVKK